MAGGPARHVSAAGRSVLVAWASEGVAVNGSDVDRESAKMTKSYGEGVFLCLTRLTPR
jgi:hypothetical protein